MLNEDSKNYIRAAIEELEVSNPSQDSIDKAVVYIKQAIEQIKKEKYEVVSIELNDIIIKKSEKTKHLLMKVGIQDFLLLIIMAY